MSKTIIDTWSESRFTMIQVYEHGSESFARIVIREMEDGQKWELNEVINAAQTSLSIDDGPTTIYIIDHWEHRIVWTGHSHSFDVIDEAGPLPDGPP